MLRKNRCLNFSSGDVVLGEEEEGEVEIREERAVVVKSDEGAEEKEGMKI